MRIIMLNVPFIPATYEWVGVNCYIDGQPKITVHDALSVESYHESKSFDLGREVGWYAARVVPGPVDGMFLSADDVENLPIRVAAYIKAWKDDVIQAVKNLVEAQIGAERNAAEDSLKDRHSMPPPPPRDIDDDTVPAE